MFEIQDKLLPVEGIKELLQCEVKYYCLMQNNGCMCDQCCRWRGTANTLISFSHDIGLNNVFQDFNWEYHKNLIGGHEDEEKIIGQMIEEKNKIREKYGSL